MMLSLMRRIWICGRRLQGQHFVTVNSKNLSGKRGGGGAGSAQAVVFYSLCNTIVEQWI